jgi:hypothetical protein
MCIDILSKTHIRIDMYAFYMYIYIYMYTNVSMFIYVYKHMNMYIGIPSKTRWLTQEQLKAHQPQNHKKVAVLVVRTYMYVCILYI